MFAPFGIYHHSWGFGLKRCCIADIDKMFQPTIVKFTLATVGKQIEAELKAEVKRAKKALDSTFDYKLVNQSA